MRDGVRKYDDTQAYMRYLCNNKSAASGADSSVYFLAVGPAEEVIKRHVKIIRYRKQGLVVRFPGAAFVAADGILVKVKFDGKAHLGYSAAFAQFFQSKHNHHLLTKVYHSGIIKISRFGIFHTRRRNKF